MKDLSEIRKEIDSIDGELAELFVRRQKIADEVAAAKVASGSPIFDPAREREILSSIAEKVGAEYETGALRLFSTLFDISKARQRAVLAGDSPLADAISKARAETPASFPSRAVVACQGAEGAYSQIAAARLFQLPTILYFSSFDDVFNAVEKGLCPYGVLPVENSAAGSVAAVYDLMVQHDFKIVRSIRQRIKHVLLAPRGVAVGDVREVFSHPHALAQCNAYFKRHPGWRLTPAANTAVAAREIAKSGRSDVAVVASRLCAELYGMDVLADDISNVSANFTRFICISRNLEIYPGSKKFSIMLTLPHRPGALYGVMAKFAAINVNLTKLESRPIPGMDFEFRFTFELEAPPDDPQVVKLLSELAGDPDIEQFSFLGAYSEV